MKDLEFSSKISKFFAHPFIIALFASGILGYIGNEFNNNYNKHEKQSSYLKEITDKKYKLLADNTNAIDKQMSLMYQIKYYKSWLHNKHNKIDDKGRTRKQVIKEYERIWAIFNNGEKCISTLAQVAAYYDGNNVVSRAKKLIKMIDEYQEHDYFDKNAPEAFSKAKKIYDEMYILSDEMGAEIKNEIKNNTKT